MLDIGGQLQKHVVSKKALIVTNTKVGPLYSAKVRKALESKGVKVFEVVLPDGEEYKTMDVLMLIIDAAMDAKLDRKSTMVALGGGVIGDMCGFAASIYQRGIKFVQIPTTVMAMVDSAVGGKTAVNHPKGKNMIGAFYQPDAVIIDINTLDTLPDREYKSGISEIIKYGLIRDPKFFKWQEENMGKIIERDPLVVGEMITRSCENKAEVVAADEKEAGVRATLNLGHTFGHAIETGMGYGAWLHGEAVAAGMVMAAEFSKEMDLIDQDPNPNPNPNPNPDPNPNFNPNLKKGEGILARTVALIKAAGLPISICDNYYAQDEYEDGSQTPIMNYEILRRSLNTDKFLDLMSMDKKVSDGQLSLVLLEEEEEEEQKEPTVVIQY